MTTVTPSRTHLKRRVDDYLWRGDELPIQRLRQLLQSHFLPFGEVAIIGGLLRELARKGPSGFRSDVDLVLNVAPKAVEKIACRLGAKRNRFGGYGVQTPLWKIDFWALRNTWAHREGYASIRNIDDLLDTTFFNVDAIVYVVNDRKLLTHENYVQELLSRSLEINLLPNPSIDGNMVRAVRRILGWDMKPGRHLSSFLHSHLTSEMFEHVKATEAVLYGSSFAALYDNREELLSALCSRRNRVPAHAGVGLQYRLPF